jgi:hypothetical protein
MKKRTSVRANRPWTKEDLNELEALVRAGASGSKMAKKLGRTRESVYMRKSLTGLSARRSKGQVAPVAPTVPNYLENLVQAVELAKRMGARVTMDIRIG